MTMPVKYFAPKVTVSVKLCIIDTVAKIMKNLKVCSAHLKAYVVLL